MLDEREARLFAECNPAGFILFARNCAMPGQVLELVRSLKAAVGRESVPILIDQEGGRVQRLQPPAWRAAPPAATFAGLADRDSGDAIEAAWLNARLIAEDLADLGITVNCAPVVDVPGPGADPIIGDRACGRTAEEAAMLGQAWCSGLLAGGVLPVIKHIPGHGRATVDSHMALPIVDADLDALDRTDFAPFAALAAMPWAMTAHVVYRAIDPERPATLSSQVIGEVIRGRLGFEGVLISDDIGMEALSGSPVDRARGALAAGCDLVLHCSGAFAEMTAIAAASPLVSEATLARLERGEASRRHGRESALGSFDRVRTEAHLTALLERSLA